VADIADEWNDTYGAYVVHYTYRPLTTAQEEAGVTATIVTASVRVWTPGANCPDGHLFGDGSTVEASSLSPKLRDDLSELMKDDRKNARDLDGNLETFWHKQIRQDIAKAPDPSEYDNNKVYVNPRWDLESQLKEIKSGRITKKIKKA